MNRNIDFIIENSLQKKIMDTDVFAINEDFSSKSKRIKINTLQKKESVI